MLLVSGEGLLHAFISSSVITDQFGCDVLQDDIYKLELWQEKWQMKFNPSKCKVLCISNKKDPPMRNYEFCGSTLEQIQSVSYLGITINDKMKWSEHISNVMSKASKTLGMAKRNFWNCPKNVKETVYSTIIRPRLEYAHIVWIHILKKDIKMLEKDQRKAARFCLQNYATTASVTDMLKDFSWKTLEQRRQEARLSMMYQMTHNLAGFKTDDFLIPHAETRTRGNHCF